jgi:hypothetical protein
LQDIGRLLVDVTSLLLANDLEVLEGVENQLSPLWISPNTVPALLVQLDKLSPTQPTDLASKRHLLKLVASGRLRASPSAAALPAPDAKLEEQMGPDWAGLLALVQTHSGYLVDHLPLTSNNIEQVPVALAGEAAAHVTGCRALIDALHRDGILSSKQHITAVDRLGLEGARDSEMPLPEPKSPVYLMAASATVLADASVIDHVCSHFEASIDHRALEQINNAVSVADEEERQHASLRRLVDRIRDGLSNGIYRTVEVSTEVSAGPLPPGARTSLELQTLRDLFACDLKSGDVLWFDDRYITSYSNRDGAPIVGILEILDVLRTRHAIDWATYYELLLQLRASNARYIPVTTEELLHHLKDAPLVDGDLVETPALEVIRRSTAACLLDRANLQQGRRPDDWASPFGETDFVSRSVTSVTITLAQCFAEAPSRKQAEAWADWLLAHMVVGMYGARELLMPEADDNSIDLLGRDLAMILWGTLGILRESSLDDTQKARADYTDWLNSRMVRKWLKANPSVVATASQALRAIALERLNEHPENTLQGVAYRLGIQRLLLAIPPVLRTEMERDPELFARVGLAEHPTIQVGSLAFSTRDFVRAAAEAISGKGSTLRTNDGTTEFTAESERSNGGLSLILCCGENQSVRVSDPMFGVLDPSPRQREATLRKNRHWFESEHRRLSDVVDKIVTTLDPVSRLEQVEGYRLSSATSYYERVTRQIREAHRFDIGDVLPPSAAGLLGHFRLDALAEQPVSQPLVDSAATRLLGEEGITQALDRFACLPLRFPASLVAEFAGLASSERKNFLIDAAERWQSPVSCLHLLEITAPFADRDEELLRTARRAVNTLQQQRHEHGRFYLFQAILDRVYAELTMWPEVYAWPPSVKLLLTWAHSTKLHALFLDTNIEDEHLADWITHSNGQIDSEALQRAPDLWHDALHPRLVRRADIITQGVTAMLEGCRPECVGLLGLQEVLGPILFGGPLGVQLPAWELLRDPMLAQNSTGSIFGSDRGASLQVVFETEVSNQLASATLHDIVARALQALKYDYTSQWAWLFLVSVVHDLPIYDDLRDDLRVVLRMTDVERLWLLDRFSGYLAVRMVAVHAVHLDDEEVRRNLEEAMVRIAEHLDQGDDHTENAIGSEAQAVNIIEAALRVTHRPGQIGHTTKALAGLLIRLLNTSQIVADQIRQTSHRFIWELSTEQQRGLWALEMELRARR